MTPPSSLVRLRITLEGTDPPIWREVLVPLDLSLEGFHDVLQVLFGWTQSHEKHFVINGETYGDPHPEIELDHEGLAEIGLPDVLEDPGQTFTYHYDYGDEWVHVIEFLSQEQPQTDREYPLCVNGERASPLEDVGGAEAHNQMTEALRDSHHPDYEKWSDWSGGEYDAATFDRPAHNQVLRDINWEARRM